MKPLVLLCLVCSSLTTSADILTPGRMWTKLILTHHWPSTFCGMEHCHPHIDYWTLHGLWPDVGQQCNSSWHFNQTLIQDLIPEMDKWWPDLLKPSSPGFWKYEWGKHGTCAAKAASLDSQHKYFSKALELYHKLDLDGVLKKFNIVPSEKYYTFDDIEGTIFNFYRVKPKIQCVHPKGGEFQILGQIEVCFNPDFQLEDCEKAEPGDHVTQSDIIRGGGVTGFMVCDHTLSVYYPPLKQKPSM